MISYVNWKFKKCPATQLSLSRSTGESPSLQLVSRCAETWDRPLIHMLLARDSETTIREIPSRFQQATFHAFIHYGEVLKKSAIWSSPLQKAAFEITVDLRNESPGMALPKLWCQLCFPTWQVHSSPGDRWPGAALSCIALLLREASLPRPALGSRRACLLWFSALWGAGVVSHVYTEARLLKLSALPAIEHTGHETRWLTSGFQVSVWTHPCTRAFSPFKIPSPQDWSTSLKQQGPNSSSQGSGLKTVAHLSISHHESGLRNASPQGWHFW